MVDTFEDMLTGGHPNSLGRTLEVVDLVLKAPERFDELFNCYKSADEVVRLRVSNAMKRVEAENQLLLIPYIDRLIGEIGSLDQASAQWTLAQLFDRLEDHLSPAQKEAALAILKRNLSHHNDWIVLNFTMETLTNWSGDVPGLKDWLIPHLQRLKEDKRKSVAARANKFIGALI